MELPGYPVTNRVPPDRLLAALLVGSVVSLFWPPLAAASLSLDFPPVSPIPPTTMGPADHCDVPSALRCLSALLRSPAVWWRIGLYEELYWTQEIMVQARCRSLPADLPIPRFAFCFFLFFFFCLVLLFLLLVEYVHT